MFALIIIALIVFAIFYPKTPKSKNELKSAVNTNIITETPINQDNTVASNSVSGTDLNSNSDNSIPSQYQTYMPVTSSLNISPTNLVNPASKNCETVGGKLQIKKDGSGGEYGLCYFEDDRACEEWALMRGDCPVGGRKTAGFDTEAQRYCVWRGGETLAAANAICKFRDNSSCLDDDLYKGVCLPGQNK